MLEAMNYYLILIQLLLLKLLQYFLSSTHKLGPALCFAAGPAGEGLVEEKAKGQQLDKHWVCGCRSFYFTFKIWTKVLKIWCDKKESGVQCTLVFNFVLLLVDAFQRAFTL